LIKPSSTNNVRPLNNRCRFFLCGNTFIWKLVDCHMQSVCQTLNTSLYVIRSLSNLAGKPVLRNIYFEKFQSVLRYEIIFWGVECESIKLFKLRKRTLCRNKALKKCQSCRVIFSEYKMLMLTSLYIFEVVCYLEKKKVYNICNYNVHEYNTRGKQDLHIPSCNIAGFEKKVLLTWV
jgi:hypothetical protein